MQVFIILFLWLSAFVALAQLPTQANFHVFRYNTNNGLPTNNINAITQDQQGFIWLATDDGLVRFDGKEFITLRHNDPNCQLPESNLRGVFADSQNRLWIATQSKGIICYELKTKKWITFPDYKARTDFPISRFAEDKSHNIWTDIIYNNPKEQKNNPTVGFQYVLRIAPTNYAAKLLAIDSMAFDKQKQKDTVFLRAVPQAGMIWADKQGNLYKGVYAYDSKTETFEKTSLQKGNLDTLKYFNGATRQNESLKAVPNNTSFVQVAQTIDKQGRVWWARDGINIFDPKQKTVQQILWGYENGVKMETTIFGLAYHEALNVMWIGLYRRGLMGMDCKTGRLVVYANIPYIEKSLPSNQAITDLFVDNQQGLWIAMGEGGLAYYHPKAQKFGHYYQQPSKANWLTNNMVLSFASTNAEEVWVGTKEGLHRWLPKTDSFQVFIRQSKFWKDRNPTHPPKPNDAINNITSLYADSTQLWIGTWGIGLHTTNLPLTNSPPVFEKHLLFRTEEQRKEKQDFMNLVDWLNGLVADQQGRLWIANWSGGLWAFDKKRKRFIDTLPTQDKVYTIGSLYDDCETCKGYKILKDGRFTSVATDGVQWAWAGTENGLYRIDLQTKAMKGYFGEETNTNLSGGSKPPDRSKDEVGLLPNSFINTIFYEPQRKEIWVGTPSGLALWNREQDNFTSFAAEAGFVNSHIKGILADNKGNLWVSTNGGLAVFDRNRRKVIKTYTAKDGLQSNSFLPRSAFKLQTGEMLFGGENGFNFFHPDSVLKNYNDFVPPIVMTKLSIEGKEIDVDSVRYATNHKIETSYDRSNIDLSVVAINFVNPEDNRYEYRLRTIRSFLGIALPSFLADTTKGKWYEARNGNIELPNQQYGYYILEIRATNNEGVWYQQDYTDNPLHIIITVTPPWYAAWWFWVAFVLFVGLSVYGLFKYRIVTLQRQKAKLEQTVAERTAEVEAQKEEVVLQAEQLEVLNKELAEAKIQIENQYDSHIHDHTNYFQHLHDFFKQATQNSNTYELYELIQDANMYIFAIVEIDNIIYSKEINQQTIDKTPPYLISQIVEFLRKSYLLDSQVNVLTEIDTNSEQIKLFTNEKMALGVIILELLRNSIKYAFEDFYCENPTISISLAFKKSYKENHKTKNIYELQLKDNGKGLPNIAEHRKGSKGLQLVGKFAQQLGAYPEINSEIGKAIAFR
jgi:ligand-binding sensor domain-containing protein/two-component sensor histidine kinase